MKNVCMVLLFSVYVLSSCKKQMLIDKDENRFDASIERLRPGFPRIPRSLLPLSVCINSYDELVQQLGTDHVTALAVILANGAVVQPGTDLHSISYEAVQQSQSNSLFASRLLVEWRYPGGNWQVNSSEVWSLGCVYEVAGEPPYTNLIKGREIIQINTCFFWETNMFTGERIAYVVID